MFFCVYSCHKVFRDCVEIDCIHKHRFCRCCIEFKFALQASEFTSNVNNNNNNNNTSNNKNKRSGPQILTKRCPIDNGTLLSFSITSRNDINELISNARVMCPIALDWVNKEVSYQMQNNSNVLSGMDINQLKCHTCEWSGYISNVDFHVNNECEYRLVECPFAKIGCQIRHNDYGQCNPGMIAFKNLTQHLLDQQMAHLNLQLNYLTNLNQKMNAMEKMVSSFVCLFVCLFVFLGCLP